MEMFRTHESYTWATETRKRSKPLLGRSRIGDALRQVLRG